MKPSLLDIVQGILDDMNGDEVNSITDTEEAEQVAGHVKRTYQNLISHTVWPHTRRALVIEPLSDTSYPNYMEIKDELKELVSIFYNSSGVGETKKQYKEVEWKDPDDFLRKVNTRNNDAANCDVIIDHSGIELLIMNDKAPEYYTSFDDVKLVFDSYDSAVDSTLQSSKCQATGYVMPTFTLQDDFIPDLPSDAFSLLIEKATSRCQLKMRQMEDVQSEGEAQKQSRWLSRKSWQAGGGGIRYPNYGRKTRRLQGLQPWDR